VLVNVAVLIFSIKFLHLGGGIAPTLSNFFLKDEINANPTITTGCYSTFCPNIHKSTIKISVWKLH